MASELVVINEPQSKRQVDKEGPAESATQTLEVEASRTEDGELRTESPREPSVCDSTTAGDNTEVQLPPGDVKLSKNQLKKMKKREKWLAVKAEKRAEEKRKRKRRWAEAKEKGIDMGPSRKSLKKNQMAQSSCKIRVVIDCSFDDLMTEKDVAHLVQQIQHSYAANRRAANPMQLYVCGLTGKAKKRLESIGDYRGWDIHVREEPYEEVFDRGSIVYLSSESPNVLDTLQEDSVYIIGGLVDHNHHKGLCHEMAEEKKIAHAQLPLSDHLMMKSRKVLAINHVFEILLQYTERGDWQQSLVSVLPQRKNFTAKSATTSKSDSAVTSTSNGSAEDSSPSDSKDCSVSESADRTDCVDSTCADSASKETLEGVDSGAAE